MQIRKDQCYITQGARGFLREEPQSGEKRREERKKVRKPLVASDS